jgi:hypothetical protein
MRRDGISREEATEQVHECREAMMEAIENGDDPEEIFMDFIGLEPDYIQEVLL